MQLLSVSLSDGMSLARAGPREWFLCERCGLRLFICGSTSSSVATNRITGPIATPCGLNVLLRDLPILLLLLRLLFV